MAKKNKKKYHGTWLCCAVKKMGWVVLVKNWEKCTFLVINLTQTYSRFFGINFCRKKCESSFNHFDTVGSQSHRIWSIMKKWPLCRSRSLKVSDSSTIIIQLPIKVKKAEHLYSALHGIQTTLKRSGMDHTVLPATNTMPALPRKRSPEGATTD